MFSLKSFRVSGLTFKSLIHFEFIFMYSVRECSNFILSPITVRVFPAPLHEEIIFSPLYVFAPFAPTKVRCA